MELLFSQRFVILVVFAQVQGHGHWFIVFERPSTWQGAKDFCHDKGGHLAEFDSDTGEDRILAEFLVELFDQINPERNSDYYDDGEYYYYHVGYSDYYYDYTHNKEPDLPDDVWIGGRMINGTFVWSDSGLPVDKLKSNWGPGEPLINEEGCGLSLFSWHDYMFADLQPWRLAVPLCEINP